MGFRLANPFRRIVAIRQTGALYGYVTGINISTFDLRVAHYKSNGVVIAPEPQDLSIGGFSTNRRLRLMTEPPNFLGPPFSEVRVFFDNVEVSDPVSVIGVSGFLQQGISPNGESWAWSSVGASAFNAERSLSGVATNSEVLVALVDSGGVETETFSFWDDSILGMVDPLPGGSIGEWVHGNPFGSPAVAPYYGVYLEAGEASAAFTYLARAKYRLGNNVQNGATSQGATVIVYHEWPVAMEEIDDEASSARERYRIQVSQRLLIVRHNANAFNPGSGSANTSEFGEFEVLHDETITAWFRLFNEGGTGDFFVVPELDEVVLDILESTHTTTGILCTPNGVVVVSRMTWLGGNTDFVSATAITIGKTADLIVDGSVVHSFSTAPAFAALTPISAFQPTENNWSETTEHGLRFIMARHLGEGTGSIRGIYDDGVIAETVLDDVFAEAGAGGFLTYTTSGDFIVVFAESGPGVWIVSGDGQELLAEHDDLQRQLLLAVRDYDNPNSFYAQRESVQYRYDIAPDGSVTEHEVKTPEATWTVEGIEYTSFLFVPFTAVKGLPI